MNDIFEHFPTLITPRMRMREMVPEDAQYILDQGKSSRLLEYIPKSPMRDLDDARAVIDSCAAMFAERRGIAWAGVLAGSSEVIGTFGFNRIEVQHKRAEIGGSLAVAHWGTGIAREAMNAVIEFGFGPMDLHTIEARVNPQNRSAIYSHDTNSSRKRTSKTTDIGRASIWP